MSLVGRSPEEWATHRVDENAPCPVTLPKDRLCHIADQINVNVALVLLAC